jgi:hypothetical protein
MRAGLDVEIVSFTLGQILIVGAPRRGKGLCA